MKNMEDPFKPLWFIYIVVGVVALFFAVTKDW